VSGWAMQTDQLSQHVAVATIAAALLFIAACRRYPTGTIEGTVSDRYGTPIANVHVGVLGLARSGVSDTLGRYRLHPPVPVGTHRVSATATDFVRQEQDSVVVRKGATTVVDFTLDRTWETWGLESPGE
jgi:Carboxypeptidase regulatory-like domain